MTGARQRERLVVLVLISVLLFQYPLLGIAARPGGWWGIPWVIWYVFGAWSALILAAALATRRRPDGGARDGQAGA